MKMNCPAKIIVKANKTGDELQVIEMVEKHNHALSIDMFHSYARVGYLLG